MEKGSRGGLEFLGRLLGAAREKEELSRGPREAHLEHHPLWVGGALGGSERLGQRSRAKTLDSQPSPFKTQDSWFFTCLTSVSRFGKGQWAGAEGLK